ncbi:hypothetical protein L195_g034974 [Trifolium pratense]|uniref:Uncharacterized protein n=1 Tax=Trifolium pratense TaxID=57577 RepID=A0A2K3LKC1_TRIPR|nr:hypothetical protein L195_g034974 [Trifolium pratense]
MRQLASEFDARLDLSQSGSKTIIRVVDRIQRCGTKIALIAARVENTNAITKNHCRRNNSSLITDEIKDEEVLLRWCRHNNGAGNRLLRERRGGNCDEIYSETVNMLSLTTSKGFGSVTMSTSSALMRIFSSAVTLDLESVDGKKLVPSTTKFMFAVARWVICVMQQILGSTGSVNIGIGNWLKFGDWGYRRSMEKEWLWLNENKLLWNVGYYRVRDVVVDAWVLVNHCGFEGETGNGMEASSMGMM